MHKSPLLSATVTHTISLVQSLLKVELLVLKKQGILLYVAVVEAVIVVVHVAFGGHINRQGPSLATAVWSAGHSKFHVVTFKFVQGLQWINRGNFKCPVDVLMYKLCMNSFERF